MRKAILLALLFVAIGFASAQTVYHNILGEVNEYTIANQPTTFQVYVHDGTSAVASADVYYELIGTETAGSVRSTSLGYANISFIAPSVGTYTLSTSANKTGYTSTLNSTTVNVYEGVLNVTGNPNPFGPYQSGASFLFEGNVREVSCCFFKENATSSCVCEYIGAVGVDYYIDGSFAGNAVSDSAGDFLFTVDTSSYGTGTHTLNVVADRSNYASIDNTEDFVISSESLFTISGIVTDATGATVPVSITITNSSGTQYTTSSSSVYDVTLVEGIYDINIQYGNHKIVYDDLNLNNNINELIMIDEIPLDNSNLPLSMNVETALSIRANNLPSANKQIIMSFDDSVTNELIAEIHTCSSWDFNSRTCSGGWSDVGGNVDTNNNLVSVSFSDFGAFAVGEGLTTCEFSTCGSTCSTKSECESVSCNWCGTSCQQSACPTCSPSNLALCTTKTDCEAQGGFFYDGVCNSESTCNTDYLTYCSDSSSCTTAGGTWCSDNTCQSGTECCSASNLDVCLEYDSCTAAGGLWCGTVCKSTCTAVESESTVEYVYLSNGTETSPSSLLTFQVSVFNPYNDTMKNTTIKLNGVNESLYFIVPLSADILPNTTKVFTVKLGEQLSNSNLDLSYDVEYYMGMEDEQIFFTFTNPLDIDWIGLFVDFKSPEIQPGDALELNITLSKTWQDVEKVSLEYTVTDSKGNVIHESSDQQFLKNDLIFEDTIPIYQNYTLGDYKLKLDAKIGSRVTSFERNFNVVRKFPWAQFLLFIVLPALIAVAIFVYFKYVRRPPEYVAVPAIKFGGSQ